MSPDLDRFEMFQRRSKKAFCNAMEPLRGIRHKKTSDSMV
jgi:hypothetical protein